MLKKSLLKYNYPQVVFAKQIVKNLRASGKPFETIIDCPCGNGETSFTIAKLTGAKVVAADSSRDSIGRCKNNFNAPQLSYEVNTIELLPDTHKQYNVFCIINSLFLLENYDSILKKLHQSATANKARVIIIIPNTEGKNFKWFQSQNANDNKLIIQKSEIEPFFATYGFKTEIIIPLCYAHHYNRKDIKLFSVFWSVYLIILNAIQTALKIGKANYFLIALSSQNA